MSGRGGNQRPLTPPQGRDLKYAHLLLKSMWSDTSPAGKRFAHDREGPYQRWRRPIRGIIVCKRGSPFAGIEDIDRDLDNLECDHRSDEYPEPRPLTPEEKACWVRPATIAKYRQDVAAFCDRWRLKAWWAVPAIIDHHFLLTEHESTWNPTAPPLSMYVYDPGPPVSLMLTVKLPGRTEEQFERDKARALSLLEVIENLQADSWVTRSHFSREERADWERSIDSSCVLLEWDGYPYLPRKVVLRTGGEGNKQPRVTPGDHLVGRCQERLGRPLTDLEKRAVRSQVAVQRKEYRRRLGVEGWASLGHGDLEFIVASVARILLTPSVTWDDLIPIDQSCGAMDRYQDPRTIRRTCQNFARLANLTLPAKRAGRVSGSRNLFDPTHW